MTLLEKLNKLRRSHADIDDTWYSCPKSGNCSREMVNMYICGCGADEHNKLLDEVIEEFLKSRHKILELNNLIYSVRNLSTDIIDNLRN